MAAVACMWTIAGVTVAAPTDQVSNGHSSLLDRRSTFPFKPITDDGKSNEKGPWVGYKAASITPDELNAFAADLANQTYISIASKFDSKTALGKFENSVYSACICTLQACACGSGPSDLAAVSGTMKTDAPDWYSFARLQGTFMAADTVAYYFEKNSDPKPKAGTKYSGNPVIAMFGQNGIDGDDIPIADENPSAKAVCSPKGIQVVAHGFCSDTLEGLGITALDPK